MGMFENPYAGLVVFIAVPRLFVLGLLLIPAGMWLQRRKLRRDPTRIDDWPVLDFRRPPGAPHDPGHRRADRRQPDHPAARRLRHRCTRWNRRRSAGRRATCRCTRNSPPGRRRRTRAWPASSATSARARGRWCTTSWSASGSSYHVVTNQIPKPIPGVADMRPALEICGNCHSARPGIRRSHPRHSRIRGRRNEHRDDDGAADARRRARTADRRGPGDPLARRSPHRHHYIATDPDRQTIPLRQGDRRGGEGPGIRRRGHDPGANRARRAAHDGLHRLPQRRRRTGFRRPPSGPSTRPLRPAGSAAICRSSGGKGSGS